jgi:hypothetical protein
MPRLILLLAIAFVVYVLYRRAQATPPEQRKAEYIKLGLGVAVLIVVGLTVTGRMHWIGAAITGLLVGARQLLPHLVRFFPMLASLRNKGSVEGTAPPQSSPNMTTKEALAVLGLEEGASEEDIIAAHRSMMQKNHPDRGGSDYLAAKINQAKDILT